MGEVPPFPPPVPVPAFLLSLPLLLCSVSFFPLSSHSFQLAPCVSLRAVDACGPGSAGDQVLFVKNTQD